MSARDYARCVTTEEVNCVDMYTVSKETGAIYSDNRHVYGDFNARSFCQRLKKAFGANLQFDQVILDYYWMPTGWLVTWWSKTLFQNMLPDLVREQLLRYPSKRARQKARTRNTSNDDSPQQHNDDELDVGVVYLPFCAHFGKEIVGALPILSQYYRISFVHKKDLAVHALWKGAMTIDADIMQTRLGKRLDQEEMYCTFKPKDI
jgi:hypothetical protein